MRWLPWALAGLFLLTTAGLGVVALAVSIQLADTGLVLHNIRQYQRLDALARRDLCLGIAQYEAAAAEIGWPAERKSPDEVPLPGPIEDYAAVLALAHGGDLSIKSEHAHIYFGPDGCRI
ncbi:MAG: hypothetical protein ACFBSD_03360 [Paracoccaceae bacterium]